MTLDLVALGVVGLFAGVGAFTGAIGQLLSLVGLVGAWLTGRFVGLRFGPAVAAHFHVPAIVGVAGLSLVLGLVVFAAVALGGRAGVRRLRRGRGPSAVDRSLGILVGATKGGALVWLLMSLVVFFDRPLKGSPLHLDTRGSEVAVLARKGNLLAHSGLPLGTLRQALAHPAALARDPQLKALARDPALKAALDRGDAVGVLRHADVLKVLSDPRLEARLQRIAAGK